MADETKISYKYSFLGKEYGEYALSKYNEKAKAYYKDKKAEKTLDVLFYDTKDNIVKFANSFAQVLMHQVIRPQRLRIATPADIEKIIETGTLDLKHKYIDIALVLRDINDSNSPNSYLTENLAAQIKARQELKYPIMIPFTELELVNDPNIENQYGLAFKLTDNAEIIYAPELAHKNHGKKFSKTNENGLPIFDVAGNRGLYTIEFGLSTLFLDWDLDLHTNSDLGYKDGESRIIISGEKEKQNQGGK